MNPTPLRALPSLRRPLLSAAAVSAALLLGACSSTAGQDAAPTSASSSVSAPSASASSATPSGSPSGSPAPSADTAIKELVAGFPSKVLPLPKGAAIQTSSLEKGATESVAQVTATTTQTPKQILAFYTTTLTAQGFKAQPGDAVDGVPLKTFVRAEGKEIATVSVVVTSGTSTFTAGATLLQASLK